MILEAYAKINWSLDITGVRDDGYHFMDMLMQPVSLSDEITLAPAPSLGITTGGWPGILPERRSTCRKRFPSVPAWAAAARMRPLFSSD